MSEKQFDLFRSMPQQKWASDYVIKGIKPDWLQKIIKIEQTEEIPRLKAEIEELESNYNIKKMCLDDEIKYSKRQSNKIEKLKQEILDTFRQGKEQGNKQENQRIHKKLKKWLNTYCPHGHDNDMCPECAKELQAILEARK